MAFGASSEGFAPLVIVSLFVVSSSVRRVVQYTRRVQICAGERNTAAPFFFFFSLMEDQVSGSGIQVLCPSTGF